MKNHFLLLIAFLPYYLVFSQNIIGPAINDTVIRIEEIKKNTRDFHEKGINPQNEKSKKKTKQIISDSIINRKNRNKTLFFKSKN